MNIRMFEGSPSGEYHYLGGEDVFSVSNSKVNVGVAIALRLQWSVSSDDVLSITTDVSYATQGAAGVQHSVALLSLQNGTWSSQQGGPASGRFRVDDSTETLYLLGEGKQADNSFVVSSELNSKAINEVVTVSTAQVGSINAYVRLFRVSPLVWTAATSHTTSSSNIMMAAKKNQNTQHTGLLTPVLI